MPPVLVPTPPSSGASPVRFQRQIITPYTPRDPVSEEIETIRELIQALTTTAIPKQRGAVWTVGSTGGNKLRAYMSLRNLVLGKFFFLVVVGGGGGGWWWVVVFAWCLRCGIGFSTNNDIIYYFFA